MLNIISLFFSIFLLWQSVLLSPLDSKVFEKCDNVELSLLETLNQEAQKIQLNSKFFSVNDLEEYSLDLALITFVTIPTSFKLEMEDPPPE